MERIVHICKLILRSAELKYGKKTEIAEFQEDVHIASTIFEQIESTVLFPDFITSETLLELGESDDDIDYNTKDEPNDSQNSQKSSQDWESFEIGREQFTLDQMKKIVKYYDSMKSNKFAKTKIRYPRIKQPNYITRFKIYLAKHGTKTEKLKKLNTCVYQRFLYNRERFVTVHNHDLRRWAFQMSRRLELEFCASENWLWIFKRQYKIVSRKVTKYVTLSQMQNPSSAVESGKKFVTDAKNAFIGVDSRSIFNTDQSGFNYELAATRTLSKKGEKDTYSCFKSPNSTTHSYTIQPLISMDGKLRGKLLICIQEKDGKFGPRILDKLIIPTNIYLTCSKSGKLDKKIVKNWVSNCFAPEITGKSILLIDSWTGQQDDDLLESVSDECDRLRIPPHTTAMIQPLDKYFFRQYKIFRKRIVERVWMDEIPIDLNNRNEIIKMHSLIFNQMQSNAFRPLIRYTFFASGYLDTRPGNFYNLETVLFELQYDECEECLCKESSFVRCSYCQMHLCFHHFFVENHFH